jgi:hypothetical protein
VVFTRPPLGSTSAGEEPENGAHGFLPARSPGSSPSPFSFQQCNLV